MKTFLLRTVTVLAILSVCGCGGPARRVTVREEPHPVPQLQGIDRLKARADSWANYQANLKIAAESPKGKFHFRAVVLASLPNRVRMEIFSQWGQTVALYIQNDGRVDLWVPSEKTVYRSEQTETLVRRLLGIPVPPDALAYALAAAVPPAQLRGLSLYSEGPVWKGTSSSQTGNHTATWEFRASPPALNAVTVSDAGKSYSMKYDPAVELSPEAFPRKIAIHYSEGEMTVLVEQIAATQELPPSLFKPAFPASAKLVEIDRQQP